MGDSEYGEEFNAASADIDKWFGQLGASRIYPLGACDKNADQQAQFSSWTFGFIAELEDARALEFHPTNVEYDSEEEEADDGELNKDIGAGDDAGSDDGMVDLEDMGKMASKLKAAKISRAEEDEALENSKANPKRSIGNTADAASAPVAREMVSPMLHKNLTKQGYKIVGSHSGVKICRWTKAALRGRGNVQCKENGFGGVLVASVFPNIDSPTFISCQASATSTLSTAFSLISARKALLRWPVQINVPSAGAIIRILLERRKFSWQVCSLIGGIF